MIKMNDPLRFNDLKVNSKISPKVHEYINTLHAEYPKSLN